MKRIPFCGVLGAALIAGGSQSSAFAQPYPVKPVRVLVASTAGGYLDRTARLITDKLGLRLGQTFVPENRAGAGGNIAGRAAAEAVPDGYTLLATTTQITINATLYKDPGFSLLNDLVPVGMAGGTPGVFLVHASHPAKSLLELIKSAQGKRITLASGLGNSSHISSVYLLNVLAKLDALHVPFKGGAPAVTAVLGNQVEVLNSSVGSVMAHVRQGRLRALAISGTQRNPALPEVPTVAELGFPGFSEVSWVMFFGPSRLSAPIVNRLNGEINQILALPDIDKALTELGMDITPGSPAMIAEFVKAELAAWTRMVKETGVTAD